jgi:hypothetical protein
MIDTTQNTAGPVVSAVSPGQGEGSSATLLTCTPQPYVIVRAYEEIYLENFMETEGI